MFLPKTGPLAAGACPDFIQERGSLTQVFGSRLTSLRYFSDAFGLTGLDEAQEMEGALSRASPAFRKGSGCMRETSFFSSGSSPGCPNLSEAP